MDFSYSIIRDIIASYKKKICFWLRERGFRNYPEEYMEETDLVYFDEVGLRLKREIFQIPRNDEAFLNGIAYHLQQSVEKLLKAFLECKGVTVPNTHDIYKLVRMSRQNRSNIVLTSWLEDRADTLTRWEMATRYNMDYSVEAQKVQEGLEEIRVLFEMNGIKEELRTELKDEGVKRRL